MTQELPPEVGAASGLESSQLVSIKLGSEALLYGGWKKTVKAGNCSTVAIGYNKLSDRQKMYVITMKIYSITWDLK